MLLSGPLISPSFGTHAANEVGVGSALPTMQKMMMYDDEYHIIISRVVSIIIKDQSIIVYIFCVMYISILPLALHTRTLR